MAVSPGRARFRRCLRSRSYRSVNVVLRQEFELFANIRLSQTLVPGRRYEGVDVVIVRENTEGLYSGIERDIDPMKSAAVMRGLDRTITAEVTV